MAKLIRESLNPTDYSEALWKMDKFMEDDAEQELADIIDDDDLSDEDKIDQIETVLYDMCNDYDRMHFYFPKGGTVTGFAKYILNAY